MKTRVQRIQQGGNVQTVESRSVFVGIIELFLAKVSISGGGNRGEGCPDQILGSTYYFKNRWK